MPISYVSKTCKNKHCCNPHHIIKDKQEQIQILLNNPDNFDSVFNEYTQDYCKVWKGGKANNYPRVMLGSTQFLLHREVLIADGINMKGLVTRHLCHNPSCCKREHLEAGTDLDNSHDNIKAGRQYSKISKEQASKIIYLLKNTDLTCRDIAIQTMTTAGIVQNISYGKTWSHLSGMPKGSKRADWYKPETKQLSLFD